MAELKVAKRYAKALLDIGKERNQVDVLYDDLRLVAQYIRGNRQLAAMFQSPVIPNYKKENVINELFKGKVNDVTLEFLLVIVRKNRDYFLRDIALAFLDLYKEYKNVKVAYVTTAVSMDDRLRNQVMSMLKKKTGSDIELQEKVDNKLIGGYILRWDDNMIDESVASQLHALRRDLSKNVYLQN